MRDRLIDALKGAEGYVEIRVERREGTEISFRGKLLERVSSTVDMGGFIRALLPGKGWGVVSFNSLEGLKSKVKEAISLSKNLIMEEPIELYPTQPVEIESDARLIDDFRTHKLEEKKSLAESYNEIILCSRDIIDSQLLYTDGFKTYWYANTEGTYIKKERGDGLLLLNAIAKDSGSVQMAHEVITSRKGFSELTKREELAKRVAELASNLLRAKPVKKGVYTTVLDPHLAGVFIHEAFGHLSEADHIYENPRARELMKLGRKVGSKILNVIDDGSLPDLRGSIYYDDEGVKCRETYLIREGVLTGRLHSRQTAKKMGEEPTGNARAQDYTFPPIVRMTNTYIENGDTPFEDMIRGIKDGIYACKAYGGETMLENFSFSAGYGYMIRDGKIEELVRDIVLQGNLFETLSNIDAIGDDFQWLPGGTCGKGGQLAPVGIGSPHIRIKGVIIGGR